MKVVTLGLSLALTGMLNQLPAAVIGMLNFVQPTGTVLPTDSIPVEVTLELDPSSTPLTTDASGFVTSGYTTSDVQNYLFNNLPAGDNVDPTTDNLYGIINNSFSCAGSFVTGCGGPPYDWNFNFQNSTTPTPGPTDTIYVAQNLDVLPGTSVTYLFGTFTPTGGSAPPGTYSGLGLSVFIQIFDTNFQDPNNPAASLHIADVPIASIQDPSLFMRTVTGAPEPSPWTAVIGGLFTICGMGWRRRRNRG